MCDQSDREPLTETGPAAGPGAGELGAPASSPPTRRSFLRGLAVSATAAGTAAGLTVPGGTAQAWFFRPPEEPDAVNFRDIQRHENAHVQALLNALGRNARPRPRFQNLPQRNLHQFFLTSQALENTGVGAYLGALPAINLPDYVAAAGSIALIEARHAGFLNVHNGSRITTNLSGQEQSFESALTIAQVVAAAGPFIRDLNGGPPLTFDPDPANRSPANDLAILNFALALEFLEQEFYNINVPIFFPPRHRR